MVEHVAGSLGLDATLVRERNFMHPRDLAAHPYAPPAPPPASAATASSARPAKQSVSGKAVDADAHSASDSGGLAKGGEQVSGQEGDKGSRGASEQEKKKRGSTPDVVCGRFQMKEEPSGDAGGVATVPGGR